MELRKARCCHLRTVDSRWSLAPCEGAGPPDYEVSSSKWCLSSSSVKAQQLHVKVMPVYHLPRLLSLKTIMYFVGVPPLDADDLSGYCPSISVLIEPEIRVPHLHLLWGVLYKRNLPHLQAHSVNTHGTSVCIGMPSKHTANVQCLWLILCFLWLCVVNELSTTLNCFMLTLTHVQSKAQSTVELVITITSYDNVEVFVISCVSFAILPSIYLTLYLTQHNV